MALLMVILGVMMVWGIEGSAVKKLTDDTFEGAIQEGIWAVKFYAPWCGHCKTLAPIWEEYATVVGDAYSVAEIDCTTEKTIAHAYSITGYPTLKLFDHGKYIADMNVPRTVKDFLLFVKTRLSVAPSQSAVVSLDSATFDDHIRQGIWFIKFYAPWCGHCKRLAPIWEEFAITSQKDGTVHVAEVDCTAHTDICLRFNVKGYPTLLLYVFPVHFF